ncbi:Crp/Fnr family transcriptional regulator [Sphingomonas sabuli]|uniref:Crp/Fnr family transcriptional regulator n=1 Tax=Sphingomonas sabuli TaxID=2764186 RepID=A0A7G9L0S0_9SPHN|nr:Crp/Fnr family transcriptional regulator [Sphingomonas sabuli]QNM82219.1 Crp/Fnr family transcriptional regulator [Sphingomonas sabuli]
MANRLLRLMPEEIRRELYQAGSEFRLGVGETIPSESLGGTFVFVVDHGVASKFVRSEWGNYSEVGMVGPEGLFPICGLLEVPAAPHVVISQIGELRGRRIRTREFHSIINESSEACILVRKYIYAFLTQIASNIMAAEQDTVEKRIARWLLMCHAGSTAMRSRSPTTRWLRWRSRNGRR